MLVRSLPSLPDVFALSFISKIPRWHLTLIVFIIGKAVGAIKFKLFRIADGPKAKKKNQISKQFEVFKNKTIRKSTLKIYTAAAHSIQYNASIYIRVQCYVVRMLRWTQLYAQRSYIYEKKNMRVIMDNDLFNYSKCPHVLPTHLKELN